MSTLQEEIMKEIKVGIIGAGGIAGGKHLPGHKGVKSVSVIAACDIVEKRVKNFAEKNDIPNVFTDYEELVRMDELDAVSVCTPHGYHAGPTVAALEAGKHVICEKPLADNAVNGQKMVDAAKKSGKILQIGLQSRFNAGNRTLKKLVEDGEFGEIYYARAMAMRRRGIPVVSSFIQKETAGGGCLIDIGVHVLDALLWIIGYPKPAEVFGSTATKFGNRADVLNPWGKFDSKSFEVEDFAMGTIKFENDLIVTLETSWASHIEGIDTTFFMGDKAGATLHPPKIFTDQEDKMISYEPRLVSGFLGEFESFHHAIRNNLPSPVPAEEVLMTSKIFDAIYESAAIGKSVRID